MSTTKNFEITELSETQSQKAVTVNTALHILDAIAGGYIIDWTATPPETPSNGDLYLVDATASGDWVGQEDNLALYYANSWKFIPPKNGMCFFDASGGGVNVVYHLSDTWTAGTLNDIPTFNQLPGTDISGTPLVGDILRWDGTNWVNDQETPQEVVLSEETGQTFTAPVKKWKGTQANYEASTKDANTVYYIIPEA